MFHHSIVLQGHSARIVGVSIDTWKAVSVSDDRTVCVWDRRTNTKLWESQVWRMIEEKNAAGAEPNHHRHASCMIGSTGSCT
jgi:WD40 repeat protein